MNLQWKDQVKGGKHQPNGHFCKQFVKIKVKKHKIFTEINKLLVTSPMAFG